VNLDFKPGAAIGRVLRRFKQDRPAALRERATRSFARNDNAGGVASLLALANDGDPEIAFQLGDCYERGIGVLHNFVEAVRWYEHAAAGGIVKAMSRLGDIYLSGRLIRLGGSTNANGECDPAMLGRNRLRPAGVSVPQEFAKALHWNRLAAEQGDADAQARLGGQYSAGLGVTANFDEAEKWFLASAEQGCASGEFGLGALKAGAMTGRVADNVKAAAWFEKAAAQGNPLAKLSLALLLIEGQGIVADPVRGAKLLTAAAEANITEAMFRLGELYRGRSFAGRNLTLAETWLRRAGTRGHGPALLALASLLIEDLATPDYDSAIVILRAAADRGDAGAQRALAQLDPTGETIRPPLVVNL
jgi:uncharacterized protein